MSNAKLTVKKKNTFARWNIVQWGQRRSATSFSSFVGDRLHVQMHTLATFNHTRDRGLE